MAIADDVRKTLTDPTPLYFLAGTADLAAQKLKEVPALVETIRAEAPERLAAVRNTDTQAVQERISQQARDAQDKLTELIGSLDTDLKKLRESAQELALQGVGRAAELAVRVQEKYDEVAEHGREAVKTWRGEAAEEIQEAGRRIEPKADDSQGPRGSQDAQGSQASQGEGSKSAPAKNDTAKGDASKAKSAAAAGSRTGSGANGGKSSPAAGPDATDKPAARKAPARKPAAKKTAAKPAE
ncbi:hypothetical protein [Streptomyces sp. XD-27]|uniref:hypothetical protein n=1 Tax=Streptomyces sp. XD-27 TaxID=3062779 RepID=UPI0026F461E6|nr:hypothetical protein [Streptomyces sp. XD-27]WKX71165.1 hypothetical protein Q3Y56_15700 [Streptomyces sp. XD-27]